MREVNPLPAAFVVIATVSAPKIKSRIVESLAPLISHWLSGVPATQFSASMEFAGAEHAPNAGELRESVIRKANRAKQL